MSATQTPNGKISDTSHNHHDDDHRIEAVSSIISLHFNNQDDRSFHPNYIHQLFDNDDVIDGYNTEGDEYKLRIHIFITPSCQSCTVEFHLWSNTSTTPTTASSTIANTIELSEKSYGLEDDNKQKKRRVVGFALPPVIEKEMSPSEKKGKTMDMDEIARKLQPALPPIVQTTTIRHDTDEYVNTASSVKRQRLETMLNSSSNKNVIKESDYLRHPLGRILKEYQKMNDQETEQRSFIVSIVEEVTNEIAQYHSLVQPLSLWFIETADCVDLSDTNNGFWKVLYLFENASYADSKDNNNPEASTDTTFRYALVGYMTLFYFYSPFRKPLPGYIVRICQILILPHHQRCGHGLEMLRSLYQYVDTDVVEINVEDPSFKFTILRNRMDYELLRQNIMDTCNATTANTTNEQIIIEDNKTPRILPIKYTTYPSSNIDDDPSSVFLTLTESDCIQAGKVARITYHQIHVAYEIYKLSVLEEKLKVINDNDTKERWGKEYRLMVKRRLLRTHKEELGGLQTKEERQQKLETIFQTLLNQYREILKIK
jgi:histone acetyltransferase 1